MLVIFVQFISEDEHHCQYVINQFLTNTIKQFEFLSSVCRHVLSAKQVFSFMFSVRYGGSIKKMFSECVMGVSLAAGIVIVVLLWLENFNWTPERHVLCVITSTVYLLLKTFGVLVNIVKHLI